MTSSSNKPAYLPPSKLGTKEYWDNLYTTELTNHAANPSDTGTNWFDDSDAEARIVAFLESLTEDDQDVLPEGQTLSQQDASFLDLGCGNGSLLFALRDEGWEGAMLGVDYSAQSVALAKNIAESRREKGDEDEEEDEEAEEEESTPVNFLEWDLLNGPLDLTASASDNAASPLSYTPSPSRLFDIILDKGTFDAISLSTHDSTTTTTATTSESTSPEQQASHPCEIYRRRLLQLLSPNGGIFLITSCNWTEPELRAWFADDADGELSVVGRVDYPTFTFGGVKGQTISTLCFRRK